MVRRSRFLTTLLVAALAVAVIPGVASANDAEVSVGVQSATAQYSDYVLLKAQVTPAGLAGTVAFTVNGSTDGLTGAPVYRAKTGLATQRYRVPLPEGEYTIDVTFTSADLATVVRGTGTLSVRPEDARIFYSSWGGRPLPTFIPVGRNGRSAPFAVIRTIAEVPDGTPGDLLRASFGATDAMAREFEPPATASGCGPMVLRETLHEFPDGLAMGAGAFQAVLSDYYSASGSCAFAVYDPKAGMSAGAGTLVHPVTGGSVVVAFVADPQDANARGYLAFGHFLNGMATTSSIGGLYPSSSGAFVPLGPNGAQITYGDESFSGQVTAFEKSRVVPGSTTAIGVTFSWDSSLSFAPTTLTRGAVDVR